MLTENLFFIPSSSSIPSYHRRPRTEYRFSSSPYQRTAFIPNHDYLSAIAAAEKEEELRRLRYEEKLRQQAYIEAMERKKKEEEEQHRKQLYLLELERQRRRQQQEAEEEQQRELLRRQFYLSQLQGRKRQDQLKEERLRHRRAKALEEIKRQERLRQERDNFLWFHDDHHHMDTSDDEDDGMQDEPMYEIVQGLDGNLYRILHENKKPQINNHMKNTSNRRRRQHNKHSSVQQYSNHLDTKDGDHLVEEMDKDVHSNLFHEGRSLKPTHVTFKDCFNVNTNNSNGAPGEESSSKANATTAFIKKDLTKKKTKKQSSIEVEDASDSECDEEYNDCWHNRRPQAGEWIEPVEGFRTSARHVFNK